MENQPNQANASVVMMALVLGAITTLGIVGYMAFVEKMPMFEYVFLAVIVVEGITLIVMRSVLSKRQKG